MELAGGHPERGLERAGQVRGVGETRSMSGDRGVTASQEMLGSQTKPPPEQEAPIGQTDLLCEEVAEALRRQARDGGRPLEGRRPLREVLFEHKHRRLEP